LESRVFSNLDESALLFTNLPSSDAPLDKVMLNSKIYLNSSGEENLMTKSKMGRESEESDEDLAAAYAKRLEGYLKAVKCYFKITPLSPSIVMNESFLVSEGLLKEAAGLWDFSIGQAVGILLNKEISESIGVMEYTYELREIRGEFLLDAGTFKTTNSFI
jgi:hypothetical protein